MDLLFISTSVGAFGTGIGGGVELTIANVCQYLLEKGHTVHLVAPSGSVSDTIPIVALPGALHSFAQNDRRDSPIQFPSNSVVGAMMDYAYQIQGRYDLIVSFAYDWLPFYLTSFLLHPWHTSSVWVRCPLPSIGSLCKPPANSPAVLVCIPMCKPRPSARSLPKF